MKIPTEPIGSIPRTSELIEAMSSGVNAAELEKLFDKAVRDTLNEFIRTGSPVITDGEQTKPSFITYPVNGSPSIKGGGMNIEFSDGHSRQLPVLTKGPFKYSSYAVSYLEFARKRTNIPLKQAVISASALSLIYPENGIDGYSHDEFINDLVNECEKDIRYCLEQGASKVQMDFTEGRLSLKLDPTGGVLNQFISLNNKVLRRFSTEDRMRIGVHVCPGADKDSTHSADVDYTSFLPSLFELNAGNFYLQLASEKDHAKVLNTVKQYVNPDQKVFVGVINVNSPEIEDPEEVRDRILEAAEYIPINQLGSTDDCGFAPFSDDSSTSRETAFLKIKSRIEGTKLAEKILFSS